MRPFVRPFVTPEGRYALVEDDIMADHLRAMGFQKEGGAFRIELNESGMEALRNTALQQALADALEALSSETSPTDSKGLSMDYTEPRVMGVLNVTPDSFSDGGSYLSHRKAIDRGLEMVDQGADMIDVGGESTRPCSVYVDAQTEMARVLPVIEALAASTDVPISVDTRKPLVAEKAVDKGALIINDVSGLREEGMMELVASTGVAAVIMHMRGTPAGMQEDLRYDDVVHEVMRYLHHQKETFLDKGGRPGQVILDPGIGFGKSAQHNLDIIRRLGEMRALGSPILVGASRKSFIARLLASEPHERLEGSLAAASVATANGADIIRAHDVSETSKAVKVAAALRPIRG